MLFAYYDVMMLIVETERTEMVKLKKNKLNGKSSNIKLIFIVLNAYSLQITIILE